MSEVETVWLDKKGHLKKKSGAYMDTDLVVLCRGVTPKLLCIETFDGCYVGAWFTFGEAAEDLRNTGFVLLGEL